MQEVYNDHSQRAHALLSASGASRWMACTPSARLEEQFGGGDTQSAYAAEGTLAHEIAELYLRYDLDLIDTDNFNKGLDSLMDNDLFAPEMLDEVEKYTSYCSEQYRAAKANGTGTIALIEERVDLAAWIPEAFGTNDFIVISDGTMEIVDLKYGRGVVVSATANKQLMLYALGALAKYELSYDITNIKLTIIQPRIDNINSWEIDPDDLMDWAETEVKKKAELAFKGEGELAAGDWCKFCKVKNRCRELAAQNMRLAQHEFKVPALLSDDEISNILKQAPKLVEWANDVTAYAQEQAINRGKKWPGFKLVEGRSIRKWVDEDKVEQILIDNNFEEDEIFDMKLKGITAMEKLLGKTQFDALLKDVVIKPQGKPTLVPISDKRSALGIEDAIKDFE